MRRIVVRPSATADIAEAYDWYESQRDGLGEEFLAALTATQARLLEYPESHPVLHRDTRRALLPRRFPYGLYYRIVGDIMAVVACMHASRNPRQWQRRR